MTETWTDKLKELKRSNKSNEPKISMGYTWDEVSEETKDLCQKGADAINYMNLGEDNRLEKICSPIEFYQLIIQEIGTKLCERHISAKQKGLTYYEYNRKGMTVTAIAKKFGVSRQGVHECLKVYKDGKPYGRVKQQKLNL